jgi:hypothetical protein
MESAVEKQKEICQKYNADCLLPKPKTKVGIALDTLGKEPLNALRHPPEADTCGWYIWGGEELLLTPDFFQPLHVEHLIERCPAIVPYLGLAPGWRVLLAGDYADIWYDDALLNV